MSERPFPIDFTGLKPDPRPRTFLVRPAGSSALTPPDMNSPIFECAPEALLTAFKAVALEAPRTKLVREEGDQVELVQRSLIFRFPDYITAAAEAVDGGSALSVYSRAVIGYSDLGVNAKRIKAWMEALAERV